MRIALTALLFLPLAAETRNMLISTSTLETRLKDDSLVLLHVGTQKDYAAGHIPGARLLTLADISITDDRGMRLQLPPAESLSQAFGNLGVSDTSQIVIYPGTDSVQSATRVWFTLDYLGHGSHTALLDGGLSLWKSEQRTLSTETPAVTPATLTVRPNPELVVNSDWVLSHLKDPAFQIYDARFAEFYSGANAGGMPRAGHIPGAVNVPYPTLLSEDKKLLASDRLQSLMQMKQGRPAVTYCHIGQQATVLYFVAKYLGMEARLYDGSFQEWSSLPELPVETK
ncbi:MAG: sulfurtransferase [Bryobacteraceae bacterium]|nr:sulfurtransferase [Bryobacteraceae bacterium]